jgi:hypothetical protein
MSQFKKATVHDGWGDGAETLREQAERCFRLARTISDQHTIMQLIELGRKYETRVVRLEAASVESERID